MENLRMIQVKMEMLGVLEDLETYQAMQMDPSSKIIEAAGVSIAAT